MIDWWKWFPPPISMTETQMLRIWILIIHQVYRNISSHVQLPKEGRIKLWLLEIRGHQKLVCKNPIINKLENKRAWGCSCDKYCHWGQVVTHVNRNYNDSTITDCLSFTFVIELGVNKNYKMVILRIVQYKFHFGHRIK